MNKEWLSGLTTNYIGQDLEYYEEIDSTNIRAKAWAKEGAKEGSIVIADYQNAGKGRLGRVWLSPKATGIWMSLILRPMLLPIEIPQITLVAGLSMCKAIQNLTGLDAKIKWPNDIVVNKKKVCGILTEMSATEKEISYVVVGIGVNVNNQTFDSSIPYATSLAAEGKSYYQREQIIKRFAEIFEKQYELYTQDRSLKSILKEYKNNCITLNKEVRISNTHEEYTAYIEDINTDGSLIITRSDGRCETIFSGEVSVRGLYGYV